MVIANLLTAFMGGSISRLIPWDVLWLNMLRFFGINYYTITDFDKCKRLQKKIAKNSNRIINDDCYGTIFNWKYIAVIASSGGGLIVTLYCSKATFDMLMENDEKNPEDAKKPEDTKKPEDAKTPEDPKIPEENKNTEKVKKTEMTIYTSIGEYKATWYSKRKIKVSKYIPTAIQDSFAKVVIDQYKKKDNAVALLYGKPNSGKTMAGLMIAQQLKASYCNTFKPWDAGQFMARLYSYTYPTEENPLVIAFDEFDISLMNIHTGNIQPNPKIPTEMVDKNGWNTFFDNINRGMYPHVIIILTTNRTPEFIKELDSSYIREGRVDLIHEFA